MDNGHVRASELEGEPLHMKHRTLMSWVSQLREKGPDSFYRPPKVRGTAIISKEKALECGKLLQDGLLVSEVARKVGVSDSTLRKAIKRGAIQAPVPNPEPAYVEQEVPMSTKSERSRQDAEAAKGMGTACHRAGERMACAVGLAGATITRFEGGTDIAMGGLLVGLPALCENGLFSGIGRFLNLPRGFYSTAHILLILGFMALARIRRPEGLRHHSAGELGKLMGLDRAPEVRTLREKISLMAKIGDPANWMKELAKTWMESDPEEAGYLYVDGHVRVYHGDKVRLPRRYVSRQRLCLRGVTDYWINDAVGKPFFVVSKAVTNGLSDTLLKDIVPELLESVPGQPSMEELAQDPLLHRFVIIFDREGTNIPLLSGLWSRRIGAITYRKNVKDEWPETEFESMDVSLPGGTVTSMKLAKRETTLETDKKTMPVIEIRRLTKSGHQTAVITTAQSLGTTVIAARMFSRWCQENFFAYMMQHYDIDGLVEYGVDEIPSTTMVVNPAWRELDKKVAKAYRSAQGLLAKLGARKDLDTPLEVEKNAELLQEIQLIQEKLEALRAHRSATPRKVMISTLPEEERPSALPPLNKQLVDTVKMIAYRAETALVALLKPHLNKEDEARALVRELMVSSADILPTESTITVRVHRMSLPHLDVAAGKLLAQLTEMNFQHPETGQQMIYTLV